MSGRQARISYNVSVYSHTCSGEGAGAGARLRTEATRRDGEDAAEERAQAKGAAVPVRGGPEEPAEDAGAGGETAEQDESLQETSGGGCALPPLSRTSSLPHLRKVF